MGYYTDYEIGLENGVVSDEAFRIGIESVGCSYGQLSLYETMNLKWYDHEKDMKAVSKLFPEVTFRLQGDGEETGDNWRMYFKDGKTCTIRAKIIYDKYGESLLK